MAKGFENCKFHVAPMSSRVHRTYRDISDRSSPAEGGAIEGAPLPFGHGGERGLHELEPLDRPQRDQVLGPR
jgi:hypothetical protein